MDHGRSPGSPHAVEHEVRVLEMLEETARALPRRSRRQVSDQSTSVHLFQGGACINQKHMRLHSYS